jgi:hypothetical protein
MLGPAGWWSACISVLGVCNFVCVNHHNHSDIHFIQVRACLHKHRHIVYAKHCTHMHCLKEQSNTRNTHICTYVRTHTTTLTFSWLPRGWRHSVWGHHSMRRTPTQHRWSHVCVGHSPRKIKPPGPPPRACLCSWVRDSSSIKGGPPWEATCAAKYRHRLAHLVRPWACTYAYVLGILYVGVTIGFICRFLELAHFF